MTVPLLGRPPPPQLVGKGRDPPWRANQWRTRTSETSQWQPGGDREQPMGGRESAWLMPWPRAPTSLLSSGHDAGRGTHNPWPGARGQRLLLPPPSYTASSQRPSGWIMSSLRVSAHWPEAGGEYSCLLNGCAYFCGCDCVYVCVCTSALRRDFLFVWIIEGLNNSLCTMCV